MLLFAAPMAARSQPVEPLAARAVAALLAAAAPRPAPGDTVALTLAPLVARDSLAEPIRTGLAVGLRGAGLIPVERDTGSGWRLVVSSLNRSPGQPATLTGRLIAPDGSIAFAGPLADTLGRLQPVIEPTPTSAGGWRRIVEPAVLIVGGALVVYLLFAVRSRT